MLAGGWAGAGPSSGLSGWKSCVGRGDERDPADAEPHAAARRGRGVSVDRVARLHLQRRRELLVEDDLARLQRAAQEAERLDVREVAGRHGQDRAGAGADRARRGETCSTPANGAVAAAAASATPGWRATPRGDPRGRAA